MKKIDVQKMTLKSLLENNKFVVALSAILAIIFWCGTAIKVSPIESKTIADIPIQFDLSVPEQANLQAFSSIEHEMLNVTIRGKKSKLNAATKDVVVAKVDCSQVTSSGTYSLSINVSVVDGYRDDFEIEKSSRTIINVWFDTLSEATANIGTEILNKDNIAEGYIIGEPALSTDIVTYSGPTRSVNQVKKVVARASLPENANEAITVEPEVVALGEDGSIVSNINFDYGNQSKLTLIIPILEQATLPVTVNFLNAPSGFTEDMLPITYSPATIPIAASSSYLSTISKIAVDTIDFTQLERKVNTREFDLTKIGKDVVVTDSSIQKITVTIDLSSYGQSSFTVPQGNIQITNPPEGYNATLVNPTMENVGVLGPKESIANITASDIYAVIDLTDVTVQGSSSIDLYKAKVTVKNQSDCWVIGTYTTYVRLTKA